MMLRYLQLAALPMAVLPGNCSFEGQFPLNDYDMLPR